MHQYILWILQEWILTRKSRAILNTLLWDYNVDIVLASLISGQAVPNVLFIVVDDLRPSLGSYRETYMHTPNIDNLAKNSVLFENAFVQVYDCVY